MFGSFELTITQENKIAEAVIDNGISPQRIANLLGLTIEQVERSVADTRQIIQEHKEWKEQLKALKDEQERGSNT